MFSMRIRKTVFAALAAAVLAAGCSSSDSNGSSDHSERTSTIFSDAAARQPAGSLEVASTLKSRETPYPSNVASSEPAGSTARTAIVSFVAADGEGTITIAGDEEIFDRLGLQGEMSMELADGSIYAPLDLVDRLVNRSRFAGSSVKLFELSDGRIADNFGGMYSVDAQPFPPAPTETTTTTTSVVSAEASQPPAETATTTSTSAPPSSEPAAETLQIQVLNASGKPGAAGTLTSQLAAEGYIVLPPANAARRYSTSAVYYREGWQTEAEQILRTAAIEQIETVTAMPAVFDAGDATVIVLLGEDTAPVAQQQQSELRPEQNNKTQLPLPASTPRDRYVPGLAAINIYSQTNDQGSLDLQAKLEELSIYLRYIGNYQPYTGATAELRDTQGTFREAAKLLEDTLSWLGFTPQNVCGAPEGYSFTDLLQPTREWSDEFKTYRGDAIFTTDRLIELHGGQRIKPSENLDFYIRQAVQTSYDALRLHELLDETETPQMILCRAWKMPEGEIPEGANAYWYALLTPGIQPRESLLSQGTYHVKEISRNGNFAYVVVCHPTIGSQFVLLHWREAGYRAEAVEDIRTGGCQAAFEEYDEFFAGNSPSGSGSYFAEDTISFSFGERSFSASDLETFPRN